MSDFNRFTLTPEQQALLQSLTPDRPQQPQTVQQMREQELINQGISPFTARAMATATPAPTPTLAQRAVNVVQQAPGVDLGFNISRQFVQNTQDPALLAALRAAVGGTAETVQNVPGRLRGDIPAPNFEQLGLSPTEARVVETAMGLVGVGGAIRGLTNLRSVRRLAPEARTALMNRLRRARPEEVDDIARQFGIDADDIPAVRQAIAPSQAPQRGFMSPSGAIPFPEAPGPTIGAAARQLPAESFERIRSALAQPALDLPQSLQEQILRQIQ